MALGNRFFWRLLGFTSGILLSSLALTWVTHAKERNAEVYTATDPAAAPADEEALMGRDTPEESSDSFATEATAFKTQKGHSEPDLPSPPATAPVASPQVTLSVTTSVAPPATKPLATTAWGMFETVPEDQKGAIAERLQLVAVLIKKYGRAYDYRNHTLSELRKLTELLEKSSN